MRVYISAVYFLCSTSLVSKAQGIWITFIYNKKKISETGVIIVAQQTELLSNTGARIPVQIVLLPIQFLAIAPGKTAEDGQVLCPLPHMWKTVVEFQASDFTVIWPRHSCYTHLERKPVAIGFFSVSLPIFVALSNKYINS